MSNDQVRKAFQRAQSFVLSRRFVLGTALYFVYLQLSSRASRDLRVVRRTKYSNVSCVTGQRCDLAVVGNRYKSWNDHNLKTDLNVSIVASCILNLEDRVRNFERAFHSWLETRDVERIIVVDWQSNHPIWSRILDLAYTAGTRPKLTILGIAQNPEADWRIAAAFNIGLSIVQTRFILKLDCDTILHPDFLRENRLKENTFRSISHLNLKGNDKKLNGVFLAQTDVLLKISGFDERFSLYGWDDTDLYRRLAIEIKQQNSLNGSPLQIRSIFEDFVIVSGTNSSQKLIAHLPHKRTNWGNGNCFNRAALRLVENWNSSIDRCHFNCMPLSDYWWGHTSCDIKFLPQAFQILVGQKVCKTIAEECGQPSSTIDRICTFSG